MTKFNVDFRLGIVAQGFWLILLVLGRNSKRKDDLDYGIDISFCRQTWGKLSAMFRQVKILNVRSIGKKSHCPAGIRQRMNL